MEGGAIVFWIGGSIAAAVFASNRGRSGAGWFFLSLVISPLLGLLFIAVSKDLSRGSDQAAALPDNDFLATHQVRGEREDRGGGVGRPAGQASVVSRASGPSVASPTDDPTDEDFAFALDECESPARKPGIWAKAFAEAHGEEARARALYTRRRAEELRMQRHADEVAELQKTEGGRRALEAAAEAARPMGHCPNCEKRIPLDSPSCGHCKADFSNPSGWKPRVRSTAHQ